MSIPAFLATRKRAKQFFPGGESVIWEVKILSVAEAMRIPGLPAIFEGSIAGVSAKLYGAAEEGEEGQSSPSLDQLVQAYDVMASISAAAVCGVSSDEGASFEKVRVTTDRAEEDPAKGVLYVGSLELGLSENGGPMLAEVLSIALSGLSEAQKTASNFRKASD